MSFPGQAEHESRDRPIRVVLVDRHAMVQEGLSRILAAEPDIAVVGLAGDGQEAILLTASRQPNLCILDADLPQIEQIIQRIATDAPAVAVLILALDEDIQRAVALVHAGARGYLSKHADGHDLIRTIRALWRGELVLTAHILQAVVDRLARRTSGPVGEDGWSHEALSTRELEVLGLLCQGRTDKEIAQTLYLSVRTVNSHLSHIYAKLGVGTRTEAMHVAFQHGLVDVATTTPAPAHQ